MSAPDGMLHPKPRAEAGTTPPETATTAEAFDTTSAEDRAAAVTVSADGVLIGQSVATLGNPADPGFWMQTPLVQTVTQGRVVSVESGKSVQLELRPLDGPASAGSLMSLPALRLLEVGLTGLHEVKVYAQ